LRPGRRLGEQLKLNVVRVAEDEHGGPWYRVRRRDRGMGDCGVRQARRPGVEFSTAADSERQVVQAGAGLVERVLVAVRRARRGALPPQ